MQETEPRRLRVRAGDLIDAFARSERDPTRPWLDRETGEVVVVIVEGFDMDEDEDQKRIDADPDRYERIPAIPTSEQFEWMVEFAESIDEDDIQEQLDLALRGKGGFARFRDVVSRYPDIERAWWDFRRGELMREANEWLKAIGIEATLEDPPIAERSAAPVAAKPHVSLVHLLLLGGGARPSEIVDGRVTRRVRASSANEARGFFKSLAREIAETHGLAWRKRFIEGKSSFVCMEMELSVEGTVIELRIAVDSAAARRFGDRSVS